MRQRRPTRSARPQGVGIGLGMCVTAVNLSGQQYAARSCIVHEGSWWGRYELQER